MVERDLYRSEIMKNLIAIIIIFLFVGLCNVHAEVKTFTESGQILEGEVWDWVSIYNDDTVVDMWGGTTDIVYTFDGSTLNMFGGETEVSVWDYSTANISGGDVSAVLAHETGTVNIYDGADILGLGTGDFATTNMNGGLVGNLLGRESGILNLHGGTISNLLSVNDLSIANVFGYNLFKTSSGGSYGYGYVSGFWEDDSAFLINLDDPETYSRVNLIPEPCTLLLVGLGGLVLRKRR